MVLHRTKCLHFPTALWNGTNTREDGKNLLQTHIYRIWIINPYTVCIHPSRRRLCSAAVCTHNFFSLLPVWTRKKFFFVRVKWAYCDTSVFRRGSELLCRWSARDVTHALPANAVPKNYSNWKWELQAEFNVVCSIGEQFNLKECLYECLIYIFFAHKSGAKKRK